jgi:hypothetical protein
VPLSPEFFLHRQAVPSVRSLACSGVEREREREGGGRGETESERGSVSPGCRHPLGVPSVRSLASSARSQADLETPTTRAGEHAVSPWIVNGEEEAEEEEEGVGGGERERGRGTLCEAAEGVSWVLDDTRTIGVTEGGFLVPD